jgi:hypothetical protein
LARANQPLLHLCVPQLTVKNAAMVAAMLNVANNATHAVSVLSDLKLKASVVTAVVATHAVAVAANELVNAVRNVRLNAVTKFVAKPVQKVVQKAASKAETKVVARVQTVAISVMNLALMQKATKLLRII